MPELYKNQTIIPLQQTFFGRAFLIERIYSAIWDCQSLSLVGSPCIGKSLLLRQIMLISVQQRSQYDFSHHLFILIDLKEHLQITSEDFFEFVGQCIVEYCPETIDLSQLGKKSSDRFSHLLTLLVKQGLYPVLLMDAFDNIMRNKEFDPTYFAFLRAIAEAGKVTYVTASVAPLHEICSDAMEGSPFFNIFHVHTLEPLTQEEARALVTQPSSVADCSFMESEIAWILSLSGHHPFLLQQLRSLLFAEKCLKGCHELDLNALKEQALETLYPYFTNIWSNFGEQKRIALLQEIRQTSQRYKLLPELSKSLLFREFLHEKNLVPSFQITIAELELALKKMNSPEALSASRLRYHKVVVARVQHLSSSSLFEIARAIREIALEALEHLRGYGIRRDTDPTWRRYHILYYRYFKHFIKNEPLASRLGFDSVRTYYRERNVAIEAFRNVLIEMEEAFEEKGE